MSWYLIQSRDTDAFLSRRLEPGPRSSAGVWKESEALDVGLKTYPTRRDFALIPATLYEERREICRRAGATRTAKKALASQQNWKKALPTLRNRWNKP